MLSGYGCVIGPWKPKGRLPFHSGPSNEYVLKRIIQYVTHVENACHIRRRNHNGKGILTILDVSLETALFLPSLVPLGFHFFRIVVLI